MGNRNLLWTTTCLLLGRLACFVGGYGSAGSYASAGSYGGAAAASAGSSVSSPGCMTCLCQAATGCDVYKQCVGDVCGAFAISWQYWKDAGQPGGDYVSCANNPSCALNCVQSYVNKFAQDCDGNGIVDCADAARLHRLGRAGCSGWLDNEFASRLSSCDASVAPPISSILAQAQPSSAQYTPKYQNPVGASSGAAGCSTCSGSGYVDSSGSGNVGNSGPNYGGSSGPTYGGSPVSGYTGSPGSNGIGYSGNSGQRYVGSSPGSGDGSGGSGGGYVGNSGSTGYVGSNYIGSSSGSSGSNGISYVDSSGLLYSGSPRSKSINSGSNSGSGYVGSTGVSGLNSGSGSSGYAGGTFSGEKYPQSTGSGPVYQSPAYQGSAGAGSHATASASASASAQSSDWQSYSGGNPGSSGTGFLAGGSGYNAGSGYSSSAGSYAGTGAGVSDHCLSCICNAATGCSLSAGCNHAGCGPLRISKAYWIDAGSPGGDYDGCTNNLQCSMNCAKTYLTKYAKDCDGDGTIQCGDYARIHRLGAYGCNGELDWQFHSQVNTCSA